MEQFKLDEHFGWVCHCGAKEKVPVMTEDFQSIDEPLIVLPHFHGPLKITLISCKLCGCQAQVREARQFLDMEILGGVAQMKNG
mgnify:CR=1 FL=1